MKLVAIGILLLACAVALSAQEPQPCQLVDSCPQGPAVTKTAPLPKPDKPTETPKPAAVDPNLPKPTELSPLPKPPDTSAPASRSSASTPASSSATGNTQQENANAVGAAVGTAIGASIALAVKHHRVVEGRKKYLQDLTASGCAESKTPCNGRHIVSCTGNCTTAIVIPFDDVSADVLVHNKEIANNLIAWGFKSAKDANTGAVYELKAQAATEEAKYPPPPANPKIIAYANGDGVAEQACAIAPNDTEILSTKGGAGFSCAAYAAGKR